MITKGRQHNKDFVMVASGMAESGFSSKGSAAAAENCLPKFHRRQDQDLSHLISKHSIIIMALSLLLTDSSAVY